MREILFRGQTRRKGERVWMDGSPVESNWVYGGIFQGPNRSVIYGYDPIEKYVVYSDTVGQFTGLTDKNGKKIFEGDILKNDWGKIFKVFFTTKSCSFMVRCEYTPNEWETGDYRIGEAWCNTIRVIGNIHDSPELLEVE